MLSALIEPLQYSFMQFAGNCALVGIICAIVGSYLMVQRLALLETRLAILCCQGWRSRLFSGLISLSVHLLLVFSARLLL